MNPFILSYDMRAPAFGAPITTLYSEVLRMCEYADAHGITRATVMEHHGSEDNYLPTPFTMAAAIAARTKQMRILLGAVILPLHDPVDIAEQIAVVDIISNGRTEIVLGAGYVEFEFQMFRSSLRERGKRMDEGVALIQRALTGERFKMGGREIFVRPQPVQKPYPIFIGGGVPAAAKRAAHFGVGLRPLGTDIIPLYEAECAKLGHKPNVSRHLGWIHVSEDPEKTWREVLPHIAHVARSYAGWAQGTTSSSPFEKIKDLDAKALEAMGIYRVVTPEQCIKMAKDAKSNEEYGLATVIGGLDPKIGWKSLELVATKVIPHLK